MTTATATATAKRLDMACEILRTTDDGERLAPIDLFLLQSAVNGRLTEAGEIAFDDLHRRVTSGAYAPPWFHGVEHLTIDLVGYVYWKGSQVEHYTPSWAYSDDAKRQALELAERCRIVEARGEPVTCRAVVWDWPEPAAKGGA